MQKREPFSWWKMAKKMDLIIGRYGVLGSVVGNEKGDLC
jgi:hypothetical protein